MMKGARNTALSAGDLAIFSSPMLVYQAIETPWRLYMPAFMTTSVGLSLTAVAGLMFWIRLFDAVFEPLLGFASDRKAGRFGRRRPWIALSVPLIVLGAMQLFFLQAGASFEHVLFAAVLLHLGHVMLVTPHGGWGLELAANSAESARIMGAKMWAYAIGIPLTLAIPTCVERMFDGGLSLQVAAMGALVVVTAPVTVATVLARVAEVAGPCPSLSPSQAWRSLAAMLLRRELVLILLLYAVLGAADAAEGAVTLFFVEEALGIHGWTGALLLAPALFGLIIIPFWTKIAMHRNKRHVLAAALALRVATSPLALLLPQEEPVLLLAYLLTRSLGWGVDYMLLRAMVADLVRSAHRDGGNGFAATHYALFNVANKLAAALGVLGALTALSLVGFVPGAVHGAGETTLRAIYALPSCLAGLIGLLALRWITPKQCRPIS